MIAQIAQMIVDCCRDCGVEPEMVLSKSKTYKASTLRHSLIYYLHTQCGLSANKLSRILGVSPRRIYSSAENIRHRLMYEKSFRAEYDAILQSIKRRHN
jgi:hypothetical protein